MSNGQKPKYAPIKKNILNEWRLSIKGPVMKDLGATKEAGLKIGVIKNNPRIDVFTGVPNDKDSGVIRAPMDAVTMASFLAMLEKVIDGPNDTASKIINFTGPPNNKVVISTTMFGKDKKGVVWLSLTAENRPLIKFKLLPNDYHHFKNRDGSDLDMGELSVIYATGWVKIMSGLLPVVMTNEYVEPEPYNQGPQQNSSAYGKNNNPNTNYKKSDFNKKPDIKVDEDDLVF